MRQSRDMLNEPTMETVWDVRVRQHPYSARFGTWLQNNVTVMKAAFKVTSSRWAPSCARWLQENSNRSTNSTFRRCPVHWSQSLPGVWREIQTTAGHPWAIFVMHWPTAFRTLSRVSGLVEPHSLRHIVRLIGI